MSNKYITIEREYGSGGTQIARELSSRINVPCYTLFGVFDVTGSIRKCGYADKRGTYICCRAEYYTEICQKRSGYFSWTLCVRGTERI